jgi:hypothetical protein
MPYSNSGRKIQTLLGIKLFIFPSASYGQFRNRFSSMATTTGSSSALGDCHRGMWITRPRSPARAARPAPRHRNLVLQPVRHNATHPWRGVSGSSGDRTSVQRAEAAVYVQGVASDVPGGIFFVPGESEWAGVVVSAPPPVPNLRQHRSKQRNRQSGQWRLRRKRRQREAQT